MVWYLPLWRRAQRFAVHVAALVVVLAAVRFPVHAVVAKLVAAFVVVLAAFVFLLTPLALALAAFVLAEVVVALFPIAALANVY